MARSEQIQYVNIKQYDKQLKIDTQILQDTKVLKTEHSSFLIENNLCENAILKLNTLQKNIAQTYLSTICESLNQIIVNTDHFTDNNYEICKLNDQYGIAIPKTDLATKQQSFKNTGIDYIISPFNVLYNHISKNNEKINSLNILILNNIIYALILNKEREIIYGTVKILTPFNEIINTHFTANEDNSLNKQKLFDEIHTLEVQETITKIMNDFYEKSSNNNFCEHVYIFYTLKQLTDEQITLIKDALLLEIKYTKFQFNDHLFRLLNQTNSAQLSFINPREKKSPKASSSWIIYTIILALLTSGVIFYTQKQQKFEALQLQKVQKEKILKEEKILIHKQVEVKINKLTLPNYRINNELISKRLLDIFDIIPNNAVLNELQIEKESSIFICNLLKKDIFIKDIQPKLLKLYKKSDLLLMQDNKPIFNTIVANSGLILKKISYKQIKSDYIQHKFITQDDLIKQIQIFLPKQSEVLFNSINKSEYLTYNFNVMMTIQEPKELFQFIEKLNKQSYPIQLNYPIKLVQTKQGLKITFNLQFHQLFHQSHQK